MKSDHSVRLHCSCYIQGLWFVVLFFFLLKHQFPSLSRAEQPSLLLIRFAVLQEHENNLCVVSPLPSKSSAWRSLLTTCPGLPPMLRWSWKAVGRECSSSVASPLPAGPNSLDLGLFVFFSVGPSGLRTKEAAPDQARFTECRHHLQFLHF